MERKNSRGASTRDAARPPAVKLGGDDRGGAPLDGAREEGDGVGLGDFRRDGGSGQDHGGHAAIVGGGGVQMGGSHCHRALGLGPGEQMMNGMDSVLEGEEGKEEDDRDREGTSSARPPYGHKDERAEEHGPREAGRWGRRPQRE